MNKLVIIPVCNFFDCIDEIIGLYNDWLEEAHIIVVDDSTDGKQFINSRIDDKRILYIRNHKQGDLRNAFFSGLNFSENFWKIKYDLVITNEHDVIPKLNALYACLSVFENTKLMRDVASVSTIYKWQDKDCYPSHPHWYNGWTISNVPGVGECKVLGAQGIPFGFALWRPEIIKMLNDDSLPLLWKLDSKFGELVYSKGYKHIRLIDYFVEHYNGGIKSWKTLK